MSTGGQKAILTGGSSTVQPVAGRHLLSMEEADKAAEIEAIMAAGAVDTPIQEAPLGDKVV